MGTSLLRGRRLRAVLALGVVVAAVGAFAGAAGATNPPSGTVSAMQTTASFTGMLMAQNLLGDCPSQAMDPANMVCEHYTLTVVGSGTVDVCVAFDQDIFGLNDVDVFVYDSNGNLVTAGITTNNPECVTFATTGGTFEVRISEAFGLGPISITGNVTFTPTVTGGGQGNGGGGNPMPSGEKETGGGKTADGGQYNLNVFESDFSKGKVKFARGSACNFRTTEITLVAITAHANGGSAHVEGNGQNNGHDVTFTADADDDGEPSSADSFTITTSDGCQGGGTVANGNVQYHST